VENLLRFWQWKCCSVKRNVCCMPQVDAESLLDQLHKYQSVQGNSEDIAKLQIQITQLQVCI
jgi:hypothetical protein